MTPKKGPLRWIEAQLATRGDLEAFMSLVDGKLRALSKQGIEPKDGHHHHGFVDVIQAKSTC